MIEKAAEIIRNSQKISVITGAGISTEAGIPDFRSPSTGLWSKIDPMMTFSSWGFRLRPKAFYKIGLELLPPFLNAKPTRAHFFLAELEKMNKISCIITQNIDGLHQSAGSNEVIEIHGSLKTGHCIRCRREYTLEEIHQKIASDEIPPRCEKCRKPIKPDIILFGDPIPRGGFLEAEAAISESDLLMIMGSSLEVYPVASLPSLAVKRGIKIIIMNLEPTPFDGDAALLLRGKLGELCKKIDECL